MEEEVNWPGRSLFKIDRKSIILETVKKSEEGEGIVLRLYESMRTRGLAVIETPFEISAAWKTNLLEEEEEVLDLDGRNIRFSFRPFEIVNIKFVRS